MPQFCLGFFLFLSLQVMGQSNAARQKTLENQKRLQAEIKQINSLLSKTQKKKKSLLSQVENLEVKISVKVI